MFMYKRCQCRAPKPNSHKMDRLLAFANTALKLMAVPSRLRLLVLLSQESHCVCDLVTHTKMSQTLISHHLADLMNGGLVGHKRTGKFIDYFLTAQGKKMIRMLRTIGSPAI